MYIKKFCSNLVVAAMIFSAATVGSSCDKDNGNEPDPPVKTVTVASQVGAITSGTAGSVTFAVATENIANGQAGAVTWYSTAAGTTSTSAPTGVTAAVGAVASNAATVTITATENTVAGAYYFKVTIDGVASEVATLTIGEDNSSGNVGQLSTGQLIQALSAILGDLTGSAMGPAGAKSLKSASIARLSMEDGYAHLFVDLFDSEYVKQEGTDGQLVPFFVGMALYALENAETFAQNTLYFDEISATLYDEDEDEDVVLTMVYYFKLDSSQDGITIICYDGTYYLDVLINFDFATNDYTFLAHDTGYVPDDDGGILAHSYGITYAKKSGDAVIELVEVGHMIKLKGDISGGVANFPLVNIYNSDGEGVSREFDYDEEDLLIRLAEIILNDCNVNFDKHDAFAPTISTATQNVLIGEYVSDFMGFE